LQSELAAILDVDRTAPPRPVLRPRPGPVSQLEVLRAVLAVDTLSTHSVRRSGGARPDTTLIVRGRPELRFEVRLRPGANSIAFTGLDRAGNASAPETLTVRWEDSFGLAVPERFAPGNTIQVSSGNERASGVDIRIFALDGTLVQRFQSSASTTVYSFTWDLRTQEGRRVKNGAYLVRAQLWRDDRADTLSRLIAVLE
jgi:hypothetical protein